MTYDRGPDALPRDGAPDIRIIGAPRRPPLDRSSMSRPGVLYTSWTSPSWLRPYALVKIRNLAPRPIRYPRTAFPYPLSFTDRPAYHPLTSALWVDRGRAYPEGRTRTDGRTTRRPERARRRARARAAPSDTMTSDTIILHMYSNSTRRRPGASTPSAHLMRASWCRSRSNESGRRRRGSTLATRLSG